MGTQWAALLEGFSEQELRLFTGMLQRMLGDLHDTREAAAHEPPASPAPPEEPAG
jgi:hypothetical protein